MNNGKKDTNNADVQKLQEQLNDIKEQVSNLVPVLKFVLYCFNLNTSFLDNVPGLFGPPKKHDFLMRPRHLSDVRRSNVRVPNL